jgi:Alternative complex III, ActD subunit
MTAWLLVEFPDSRRFVEAARRARSARYRLVDAFTPFPVKGVHELLDHRPNHIRVAMFVAGVAMAALAYGTEYYSAVISYPYNTGGRPLDAWPAFMLVPFATGILVAAIAGFITFLLGCGLPRLHHSLFIVEGFERASQDRFFLAVTRPADGDEVRQTIEFFRGAGATAIREVEPEAET